MKPRRLIILMCFSFALGFIPSAAESKIKTYKWLDCFVPLGRVVTDVSAGSPRVIEVDIPASVAEASEVKLVISAEIPHSHDASLLSLQAGGKLNLNGRVHRFPIKNKIDIPLEKGALKTGVNFLRFETDSISARWSYDILSLEFLIAGTGGRPAGAAAAGPPSQKQSTAASQETPMVLSGDIHQWEDYRQAFKTKIGISNRKPQSVQIDLPEAVIDSDEVQLFVSTSAFGAFSYNSRVQLYINAQPLAPFPTGPDFRLNIDQGFLKTGLNTLRFETTGDRVEIYQLELRLPDVLAHATPSNQPPLREENNASQAPHPLKLPERPAVDSPGDAKSDGARPHGVPPETTDPQPAAGVPAGDPGQRWAVVIGVSSYEDSRIPSLRYANRDAQAFYHWLVSSGGGRFAPSKVMLLVDRDASTERIKDALFNWLKQALEEDVVVIFFAGHGSPESPNAPQNLYLLPHNSKYDNIAVTGFPMWDIETALKRFIKAKRVVIIADACHAAGVGQAFDVSLRADRGLLINQINSGLQGLTEVGEGVCVISASRDREFSVEGREWGGGHGVFSYYLIEGLKGSADFDKSGSVSVGEITVYVSQQVRRATRNAQNPIVAGRFDPSLTIAK